MAHVAAGTARMILVDGRMTWVMPWGIGLPGGTLRHHGKSTAAAGTHPLGRAGWHNRAGRSFLAGRCASERKEPIKDAQRGQDCRFRKQGPVFWLRRRRSDVTAARPARFGVETGSGLLRLESGGLGDGGALKRSGRRAGLYCHLSPLPDTRAISGTYSYKTARQRAEKCPRFHYMNDAGPRRFVCRN